MASVISAVDPLALYDFVYFEAQQCGRLEEFLERFGSRAEYAKNIGLEA